MLTAWGDESGSQPGRDPHTYLMAAALCDESDVPEWRNTMEQVRLVTEPKVHWHGSSPERRHLLVEAIASLPMMGLVLVHTTEASDRRHRRKCFAVTEPRRDAMRPRYAGIGRKPGPKRSRSTSEVPRTKSSYLRSTSTSQRRSNRTCALGGRHRVRSGGTRPRGKQQLSVQDQRCCRNPPPMTLKRRKPQTSSSGE